MKIIITNLASECLRDIYDYNSMYSYKNATETHSGIISSIRKLEIFPFMR